MIQREGCGMSCVKKEILIGGKAREDHYARLEKREKRGKQKASYMVKPSWLHTQDFRTKSVIIKCSGFGKEFS